MRRTGAEFGRPKPDSADARLGPDAGELRIDNRHCGRWLPCARDLVGADDTAEATFARVDLRRVAARRLRTRLGVRAGRAHAVGHGRIDGRWRRDGRRRERGELAYY